MQGALAPCTLLEQWSMALYYDLPAYEGAYRLIVTVFEEATDTTLGTGAASRTSRPRRTAIA